MKSLHQFFSSESKIMRPQKDVAPTVKEQSPEDRINLSRMQLSLTIDPIFCAIFAVSLSTRLYNLEHPRAVVFDELHYIKFITLYAKRIFFFDPQPPFGKQLMTFVSSQLTRFDGDLSYSQIGDTYKPEVPIFGLRLLPCLAGSLLAPCAYLLAMELKFRQATASLVALLLVAENSLLTQSRFILLEPILILFSVLAIYSYLKFTHLQSKLWLCLASLSSTLAICTKYSGLYNHTLLLALVAHCWWNQLDKLKPREIVKNLIVYSSCLLVLPIAIYISIYYVHLSWLTKAGPHDNLMTSAFQASLENGLASIIRGQPLEIVHGSQISLRHTHGRSCWLHSHPHLYPIKYADGRGSSHQQQVTCYSFKDVNNWWIVKRPHIDELTVSEPFDKIKNGDLIQLVHGMTGRTLNSHDVASAMSPYSQEVSCYVDHNISMPEQDVWQLRLLNPGETNDHWHMINSKIQLVHLNSSLALRYSGKQLPDWGFHQHEIVADKEHKSEDTVWNVEEHRHTKSDDQKERELQLGQAEFVPLEPTSLTFWEKFYELHYKLFVYQQDAIKDHIYACESPLDWILSSKGTAYWVSNSIDDNAQIFLISNVSNSIHGLVAILLFSAAFVFYIIRRRREIFGDLKEEIWNKFQTQALVLLNGYLLHVLPYFLYESPLFLQFYLSAIIFKIFIIGALVEHLYDIMPRAAFIPHSIAIFLIARSFDTFIKLLPLSYGSSLTKAQVEQLRWKDTWQLISIDI